jgi:cyclin-dependent kinase regulatory subunit CKS1
MVEGSDQIMYSAKYADNEYEYRHVILPYCIARKLKKNYLMNESEWRGIGVQQSTGWIHYAHHRPEPHILLFRRVPPPDLAQNSQPCPKSKE